MRVIFLSFLLSIIFIDFSYSQKYSLGTDYSVLLYYPEDYTAYAEPFVLQYGLAATKEVSLRSHVILGTNYYQTNLKKNDSAAMKSNYLEVPLYLKVHYSMFDKIYKGHMIFGVGFNMLLSENTLTNYPTSNESINREVRWKPEAANLSWGLGFDVKISKAFYISIDGILKGHYLFRTAINDTGDKFALIPLTKGGIFLWLN